MDSTTIQNKEVVKRFNRECIGQGDLNSFREILADDVINHAAPAGMPNGADSFISFLNGILRKGFPDLQVEILEQVGEGDLVATRKKITGRHTGEILGIPPSNKLVEIKVIDIIRIK